MDTFFAVTAPGLEKFTALELSRLNLMPRAAQEPVTESGGIAFRGDLRALYTANLHLRTANRILARVGNFFYAETFTDLLNKTTRLPWERFLQAGQPVALRVTCHKSKLYHSDAVAQRVREAMGARLGAEPPEAETTSPAPHQLIVVRVNHNQVTISIDASGDLLHRRGYRLAVAKAPLRETLAAAMLLASGWDFNAPLIDPFCGSGTVAIEAALMARGIAPGLNRRFAFMDWQNYDAALWQEVRAAAQPSERRVPTIFAADRDTGAVQMARENAQRAGVAEWITFQQQAISHLQPPAQVGWVVTNPPYGVRIEDSKDLRNLYAQFGNVLRARCPNWHVAVLCNDPILIGQMGIAVETALFTVNGGIPVKLECGQVSFNKGNDSGISVSAVETAD
ncbi:MAG: RNA methyltransferase [Anaerolineales bacterium]